MMTFNDYLKFVTEQIVMKIDEPKEKRKAARLARKKERPPLSYRAFGVIPLAMAMFFKSLKKRRRAN